MLSLSSYLRDEIKKKFGDWKKKGKYCGKWNSEIAFDFHFMKWTYMSAFVGTGKGGKSIWGQKFEDEIVPYLKVSFPLNYFFVRW